MTSAQTQKPSLPERHRKAGREAGKQSAESERPALCRGGPGSAGGQASSESNTGAPQVTTPCPSGKLVMAKLVHDYR